MSKKQYAWLAAMAIIAWRQQQSDDDQDEPFSLAMQDVIGIAGRLIQHERQAANEMEARLIYLALMWLWNCAKYRANVVNGGPILCQLTWHEFSSRIPQNPSDCLKIPANLTDSPAVPYILPAHRHRPPAGW